MPLQVQLNRACPKCGRQAMVWHVGDPDPNIECQNCGTWFKVTRNYGEVPPEERKGKVKE